MATTRTEWMELALREAEKARGRTRPNPMVGCVIAKGRTLISVGHHVRAGTPHAEVVALRRAGSRARGADAYVTLEPCDHVGRTGPCTQALIEAGVKRVIIGTRDPNPIVNGRGIKRLRAAGIAVEVGLLRPACQRLNEAYEHVIHTRRPFVVVKLAQSLDGRVATHSGQSQWITSDAARQAGHGLRNIHDAILVGSGTVLADDPSLTCRVRKGRDPVRVVLDSQGRTPPTARVIQVGAESEAPTMIMVGESVAEPTCQALRAAGADVVRCPLDEGGRISLQAALRHLVAREMLSVLVEGGPTVVGAMFDQRLVDKVEAFIAPLIIGGVGAKGSVGASGFGALAACPRLREVTCQQVGGDFQVTGYPVFPSP